MHQHINHSSAPACLDGSAPAFWLRNGEGRDAHKLLVQLQGGGWCDSYDSCHAWKQMSNAKLDRTRCQHLPRDANLGYEGARGILSHDSSTSAWHNWALAFVRYCDGGAFLGARSEPVRGNKGLHYHRGRYNLDAALRSAVARVRPTEVIFGGCSAGGVAALAHCERVAQMLSPSGIPVRCIVDAALFPTVNFDPMLELIQATQASLPRSCVIAEATHWRACVHARHSLQHSSTPTFVVNSLFNWRHGAEPTRYRDIMLEHLRPVLNVSTVHGAFVSSCDTHCEGSHHWNRVRINGTLMRTAVQRWYFTQSVEKHLDPMTKPNGNKDCTLTPLQNVKQRVGDTLQDWFINHLGFAPGWSSTKQ